MAGITLDYAQAQLEVWLEADRKVAAGQSFSVAGRNYTRVNASEITDKINFWDAKVRTLTALAAGRGRTRFVVFE